MTNEILFYVMVEQKECERLGFRVEKDENHDTVVQ